MSKNINLSWKTVSLKFMISRFMAHTGFWPRISGVMNEGFGLRSYFNTDILRWVMVMFAFRMVMVARVGDQVYSDEQEYFYCNTNTPGCNQVCPPYNITRKMLTMLFRCVLVIFHQ